MAKMTEFQTPMGARGNLLSPSSWIQLILGAVVMIITFAVGQNITKKVGSKLPIDTQPDPFFSTPVMATSSAPSKLVY